MSHVKASVCANGTFFVRKSQMCCKRLGMKNSIPLLGYNEPSKARTWWFVHHKCCPIWTQIHKFKNTWNKKYPRCRSFKKMLQLKLVVAIFWAITFVPWVLFLTENQNTHPKIEYRISLGKKHLTETKFTGLVTFRVTWALLFIETSTKIGIRISFESCGAWTDEKFT